MLKPSAGPIAKALPAAKSGKFNAQFSMPGLVPDLVRNRHGQTVTYSNELEAEHAAMRALFNVFESRMIDTRKLGDFQRIAPGEFAMFLANADVTPTFFAEILGTTHAGVMQCLDGSSDVPHWARLIAHLLPFGNNFKLASELISLRQKGEPRV
jgi:hypothetical protein